MSQEVRIVTKERKEPDLQLVASALLDLVLNADEDDEQAGKAAA